MTGSDPKRFALVIELFQAAIELPAEQWRPFLEERAADDVALREEVLALLVAGGDGHQESFLQRAQQVAESAASMHLEVPQRIGPYRILGVLGEGGMGTVYKAEEVEPFRRLVALKVIQAGLGTKEVLARFHLERKALAAMNHRCIAKVFNAGATEQGQPYVVMELVEGLPLTRYCNEHRLSLPDRLRLFQQVCEGVQHAHLKGVLHRDLKPGNVLVVREGEQSVAKIIDFGLAKATDRSVVDASMLPSERGRGFGTLEYVAPEQAAGKVDLIDARSDIYSLGVMLYELLCGELPFPTAMLQRVGTQEAVQILLEQEPAKPSTNLVARQDSQALAEQRRTTTDALHGALHNDLDWVVLKAMAKEPERRYDAATSLAADLQRYLEHLPVLAGPPSAAYRLRKFVRRYRVPVIAAAAVMTAIVAGSIGTWVGFKKAAAKVHEFDQLAAMVLYERAVEAEKKLYPAWPKQIEAMERWLRDDAGKLLAMRREIEQTVVDLRTRALPATAEERERDRTTHPKFGEWQKQVAKLESLERANAIRTGVQELALPLPTAEERAMTPSQLNEMAWPWVDWDENKRIWGEEVRALVLAQLAWEAKDLPAAKRALFGDTLAWAWFANGKDTEAVAQSKATLALVAEDQRQTYAGRLASLLAQVKAATGDVEVKTLARLRIGVVALAAEISAQRSFRFGDESQRFLHDTLSDLLGKLASLDGKECRAVDERLSWARQVAALTLRHPRALATWQTAREAIARADGVVASDLYRGHTIELRDEDVIGLVPIGMNPVTKLWEFYELRSAWDGKSDPATIAIPHHVAEGERHGHIEVGDDTGIVFVLLPGGTFTMGAQSKDKDRQNYDMKAKDEESPHRVTLAPFFLGRHELTKGQWTRLSGGPDPSAYRVGKQYDGDARAITSSFPVEQVDWRMCDELLRQNGLSLPTEAQWEYGCRAGATTPWWTGAQASSLGEGGNLLDRRGEKENPAWGRQEGDFDDGWVSLAPVGSYRPNAYGLFDVHGNVWEWCLDQYGPYSLPARRGDGLRLVSAGSSWVRINRGGCCSMAAVFARSAFRRRHAPTFRSDYLGLRPARSLQP